MNYLHVPIPPTKGPKRFMEQPVEAQLCNTDYRPPTAGAKLRTIALLVGNGCDGPDLRRQLREAAEAFNPEARL